MANLETFLQELLGNYLPGYSIEEGGVLHQRIIQPILDRVGEGALTTDVNAFLKARLLEEFPEAATEAGDALTDILIHATGLFFESYRRELAEIAQAQSLAGALTLEDATALAANWYVVPKTGTRASTFVRVEFARPTTFGAGTTVIFRTRNGLVFYPATTVDYTAFSMLDNVLANGNYYVDILVVAEEVGAAYNVAEKEINVVTGLPGAVAVYNISKVENGSDADTAVTLAARIPAAINERSIVTAPGVVARVTALLDNVANVQVIGFKDPEMARDEATTQATAETFAFGAFVAFDRHVLVYTMGNEKPIVVGDKLQLVYPDTLYSVDNRSAPETFDITEVIPVPAVLPAQNRYLLYIDGTPSPSRTVDLALPDGLVLGYCKAQKTPVVITNVDEETVVYPSGQVHFGGHSDAYISTYVDSETTSTLTAYPKGFEGIGFTVPLLPLNVVDISGVSVPHEFLVTGNIFKIGNGDLQGLYVIAACSIVGAAIRITLRENLVTGDYGDIDWSIIPNVDIDLYDPAKILLPFAQEPFTVDTIIGNPVVTCSLDVSDYDVAVGNVLRILDSEIAGEYTIRAVNGVEVTLNKDMAATHVGLAAEIRSKESGILRPLTQVTEVKIDGNKVPYGKPLLAEVLNIGGAREIFVDGSGCVFPPVQECLPVDVDGNPVDVSVAVDYLSSNGNERSYSADVDLPDNVILTLETWDGAISEFTQEIFIPRFVWEQGRKNNVYIATGNISYSDLSGWINTYFGFRELEGDGYQEAVGVLPIGWRTNDDANPIPRELPDPAQVASGDVLTITSGPNKGSYIVEDSYLLNFNFGTVATPRRLPIRIIRIQGEFPSDPFSGLYSSLDSLQKSKAGKSTLNFGDALRLFLSPHNVLSAQKVVDASADIIASIEDNLGIRIAAQPELPDILNLLDSKVISSYSCGKAATGVARVYFQDPVTFELQTGGKKRLVASTPAVPPPGTAEIFSLSSTNSYVIDRTEADSLSQDSSSKLTWRRDFVVLDHIDDAISGDDGGSYLTEQYFNADLRLDGNDVIHICQQIHGVLLPESGADDFFGLGVVSTKSGSNRVTWQPTIAEQFPFAIEDVGALFFLESGPDKGAYTIAGIDSATKSIILNRSLTYTTPSIRTRGRADVVNASTVQCPNIVGFRAPNNTDVGKYITLYNGRLAIDGADWINRQANIGTFEILSVTEGVGNVEVEFDGALGTNYLLDPSIAADTVCSWIITETPSAEIIELDDGYKECIGQVDYSIYDSNPLSYYLYDVLQFEIGGSGRLLQFYTMDEESPNGTGVFNRHNFRNPFRLVREGQYLITSKEMAQNVDGSVYYADLPIRSIGFQDSCNTAEKICDIRNYRCEGYRMRTDSYKSSFSVNEGVHLILPAKFTPETEDYFTSSVLTADKSVQIKYRYCVDVSTLQAIMDNYSNKVMCASLLARRMLPASVGLNITYTSGVSEEAMKEAISKFLVNSFATRNVLSVSSLVSTMYSNGATHVVLPLEIVYIVEDLNRDRFLRKAQDALRYVDVGYYEGTSRITHWNPSSTMILLSRNSAARNLGI
jgi:hypothetical protein